MRTSDVFCMVYFNVVQCSAPCILLLPCTDLHAHTMYFVVIVYFYCIFSCTTDDHVYSLNIAHKYICYTLHEYILHVQYIQVWREDTMYLIIVKYSARCWKRWTVHMLKSQNLKIILVYDYCIAQCIVLCTIKGSYCCVACIHFQNSKTQLRYGGKGGNRLIGRERWWAPHVFYSSCNLC